MISYSKTTGRYNLSSDEKSDCISITGLPDDAPASGISECWGEGDSPDIEGLRLSEVAALMRKRLKSYWISTRRQESLAVYDWIAEHANAIDLAWLKSQEDELERNLRSIRAEIAEIKEADEDAESA